MKKQGLLLAALLLAVCSSGQKTASEIVKSPRTEKIINSDWTFNYFPDEKADKGYEASQFNDLNWPAVSIPHTWFTYETTGGVHPFIRDAAETDNPYWWTGWGWYRKHFTVNQAYSDYKVFLEFEGVQKYCKVWINGKYLGEHKGGYGSFDFDLTPWYNRGKENVVAVAVNNTRKDKFSIPPMAAGSFNVYGGIYRDVTIVLKDKLYIPMQGSASHEGGTFITTPGLTAKQGIVRVQTWVQNDYPQAKTCQLNTYIIDAAGKVVQVLKSKSTINPGELFKFDQSSKPVKNPHLWSPEDPYMYKVYSEVTDGTRITDSYSSPLGFRWMKWDYKENVLYINGKKTILHGGSRQQDYPWLGDAIPKWITMMDLKDIRENLNYNFLRTAHYPNDKIVYDITDRSGIITLEETPSLQDQGFSSEVQEQQVKEMIRRDRNHPGIFFWSMGNETGHAADSKFAVAEDTTRIIADWKVSNSSGGAYIKLTEKNLPESLPGCSVRGWYNKDFKDVEPADPQKCGTEESVLNILRSGGSPAKGNISSLIYADHGSERKFINSPLLNLTPAGYVDPYRIPKYAYFFWQSMYSDKPMVFIEPHYWRSQYTGQKKDITVHSDCDKVELKVNGVSKGIQVPDELNFHTVIFKDINIENGTISATGTTKSGKTVTKQVVMAGDAAKIVLTGSHQKITADRGSVVILTADITDQKGTHIYGATNTLKWSISGPASLAGPAVYESDTDKNQSMDGVWYIDMPVGNVVRSTGKSGKIRVVVSASGLASGTFDITAEEVKPANPAISEPPLSDEGRKPVPRPEITMDRLDEIPKEIALISSDLSLGNSDRKGYAGQVKDYIFRNNPSVDTSTVEFRTLINLYATHLINNTGHLAADDYNFDADNFNNCRLISGYINATKLPPLFKDGLKKYYAESIILKGSEKNAGDEMNWMNWIPSGGTVVISQDGPDPTWPKGTVVTSKTDLIDLITTVYPVISGYSDDARVRALVFISKMNPYVQVTTSGDKKVYSAQKGKPILIPLIKFIAK